MKVNPLRKRQFLGMIIGGALVTLTWVVLSIPSKATDQYSMIGPLNTGHENLDCKECHVPAKGNLGQQIQTNIMYVFGARSKSVTFGLENVDTKKCQACHDRPNDRHPVHRFEEPRFAEARKNIQPTDCQSCHLEHNGMRLTIENTGFCVNCHGDTEMKDDPLDTPHDELIANEAWSTCLQCHDFHGNHIYEVPHQMKDTIPLKHIIEYVNGGKSPFSDKKKYLPKETILN